MSKQKDIDDDDDVSSMWRDWHKWRQEKRASNLEASTEILRRANIPFTLHNNGVHLVVEGCVDFWPSTGLWIDRKSNTKRRGVHKLIDFLKRR